jgi:hypothetical protein
MENFSSGNILAPKLHNSKFCFTEVLLSSNFLNDSAVEWHLRPRWPPAAAIVSHVALTIGELLVLDRLFRFTLSADPALCRSTPALAGHLRRSAWLSGPAIAAAWQHPSQRSGALGLTFTDLVTS